MRAQVGDWLVVQSRTDTGHARRAEIIGTHPDGEPPYSVRWIDDGRETLVFPGPDAHVFSAAQQAEIDRAQTERIVHVQSAIAEDAARD